MKKFLEKYDHWFPAIAMILASIVVSFIDTRHNLIVLSIGLICLIAYCVRLNSYIKLVNLYREHIKYKEEGIDKLATDVSEAIKNKTNDISSSIQNIQLAEMYLDKNTRTKELDDLMIALLQKSIDRIKGDESDD